MKFERLEQLVQRYRGDYRSGKVADYIPELSKAEPSSCAISYCSTDGQLVQAGDVEQSFTMQSVSKVISLALAIMDNGVDKVFKHVGMEPTGDPFHSIIKLETSVPSRPLNPMINAGALMVTSLIHGQNNEEKLHRLVDFSCKLSNRSSICVDQKVAQSEWDTAHLNRALCYFMKQHGVLQGDVDDILYVYVHQCAIQAACSDLARIGAVLANNGHDLITQETLIPAHIAKICKTFMVTCGMYNASGEFAIRVGIPAKSGVSGAVMCAIPGVGGIGLYGPALDEKGNSVVGIKLLEAISSQLDLSIF